MAPREKDVEEFNLENLEEQEDEENEEYNIGNPDERREYLAEVRVRERETANRQMARDAELQYERRQAVAAMEQMIESQQRIERIQRSLAYLRDLHSRMVDAGIGLESDDEEDEDEYSNDEEIEPTQDHILNTRTNNIVRPANSKRVQTISETSDVSMKDEEEGKT